MRVGLGASLPNATLRREGREKKPSVITALSPSSSSNVETPRNVTARSPVAAGTSNRVSYEVRSGRPSLRRMAGRYRSINRPAVAGRGTVAEGSGEPLSHSQNHLTDQAVDPNSIANSVWTIPQVSLSRLVGPTLGPGCVTKGVGCKGKLESGGGLGLTVAWMPPHRGGCRRWRCGCTVLVPTM